jgi:hypothetical protein
VERSVDPLHVHLAEILERDRVPGLPIGAFADDDAPRLGERLNRAAMLTARR